MIESNKKNKISYKFSWIVKNILNIIPFINYWIYNKIFYNRLFLPSKLLKEINTLQFHVNILVYLQPAVMCRQQLLMLYKMQISILYSNDFPIEEYRKDKTVIIGLVFCPLITNAFDPAHLTPLTSNNFPIQFRIRSNE